MNLSGRDAFVKAVIDFTQERGELRIRKAGNLSRAHGALKRTGEHRLEAHATQPQAQGTGFVFALRRQREIGAACVLAGAAPFGLAVTGEIDIERQAGLPIISGRPERSDRLALSMTAPARTR